MRQVSRQLTLSAPQPTCSHTMRNSLTGQTWWRMIYIIALLGSHLKCGLFQPKLSGYLTYKPVILILPKAALSLSLLKISFTPN